MSPIERAVEVVGGQSALARELKVKPQSVQQWVSKGRVPAKRAIEIEAVTNHRVTRHQLRPDLYPADSSAA